MTPKEKRPTGQQPLLGSLLEFLIDLDHELVRLAQIIPWVMATLSRCQCQEAAA